MVLYYFTTSDCLKWKTNTLSVTYIVLFVTTQKDHGDNNDCQNDSDDYANDHPSVCAICYKELFTGYIQDNDVFNHY